MADLWMLSEVILGGVTAWTKVLGLQSAGQDT